MPSDTRLKAGKKPKEKWISRASKFLREDLNIRTPSFNAIKPKKQQKLLSGQNDVIEETVKRVFKPDLIKSLKNRNPVWTKMTFKWQQTLKRLLPLGGNSEGNKITLYDSGDDAFRAMWAAIDNAKHRVWLETYILEPDNIGKRTINGLIKAAKSGCDVRLIYDYVGSTKLNSTHLAPLIAAGAQVVPFNPLLTWPWKILHWGFFRNHRKILVVDDTVAFTGGMNIGDQYATSKIGGNGYFRDTHVKVEGPAIFDLAKVFLGSLAETGAKLPPNPEEEQELTPLTKRKQQPKTSSEEDPSKGIFVQVLQSNVPRNKLHIQKAMRLTLNNAMHHCYLTTPYFVPPQQLKRAMINAAKRGVDIRILTAGVSDVILVKLASQHVYSLLLRNGVRIYELFGSTLHAKTATIDGIYSSVGSFNLDTLSHYYNLEINLTILDHRMASQLEDQFSRDMQYCTEVTLEDLEARSVLRRFIHWAAYHILRILSIKPLYNRVMFRNRNLPISAPPSSENVKE